MFEGKPSKVFSGQGDGSCKGSKTKLLVLDDDELVAEVERVEVKYSRDSVFLEDSDDNEWDYSGLFSAFDVGSMPEDIAPHGYDSEFWSPLIEDAYDGSNAVELLCTDIKPF
ncbi:unnamed protein product [Cochlearia groenlandica]